MQVPQKKEYVGLEDAESREEISNDPQHRMKLDANLKLMQRKMTKFEKQHPELPGM